MIKVKTAAKLFGYLKLNNVNDIWKFHRIYGKEILLENQTTWYSGKEILLQNQTTWYSTVLKYYWFILKHNILLISNFSEWIQDKNKQFEDIL